MTKRSRAASILAVAGLTLALLGLAAPANAERYSVDDPADASASLNDIYGLTVRHGEQRVRFTIRVDDLRRSSSAGATLFLDTNPADKGPEYALGTGLSDGTDYALTKVEGWRGIGGQPLHCNYTLHLRYKADVVNGWISRGCLGKPDTVRAAVKMVDTHDASHKVTDWAPAKKKLGLAIAPG
ncbi:MAG TPA: hypothetical protein VNQ53_19060 [Nocardioides sp.]|nr:hypothetical protein [Nocardioides sp.]